jgi:hypothetical protein
MTIAGGLHVQFAALSPPKQKGSDPKHWQTPPQPPAGVYEYSPPGFETATDWMPPPVTAVKVAAKPAPDPPIAASVPLDVQSEPAEATTTFVME